MFSYKIAAVISSTNPPEAEQYNIIPVDGENLVQPQMEL